MDVPRLDFIKSYWINVICICITGLSFNGWGFYAFIMWFTYVSCSECIPSSLQESIWFICISSYERKIRFDIHILIELGNLFQWLIFQKRTKFDLNASQARCKRALGLFVFHNIKKNVPENNLSRFKINGAELPWFRLTILVVSKIFYCLKMKSVENILKYLFRDFLRNDSLFFWNCHSKYVKITKLFYFETTKNQAKIRFVYQNKGTTQ